jgi:hypothetical protein
MRFGLFRTRVAVGLAACALFSFSAWESGPVEAGRKHRAAADLAAGDQAATDVRGRITIVAPRARRGATRRGRMRLRLRGLERHTEYRLLADDPSTPDDPTPVEFATVRTRRKPRLTLRFGTRRRPLPHGASVADLYATRIEVRTGGGEVALAGDVPVPPADAREPAGDGDPPACVLRDVLDLEDDFDDATAGDEPPDWDVTGTADTGQEVVVDDAVQDGDSGNSMKLADTLDTGDGPAAARGFTAQSGRMAVEFTLISSDEFGQVLFAVAEDGTSGPVEPTGLGDGLGFYDSGRIGFATDDTFQDYETDTAYRFRVDFDLSADTFDVTIDGTEVVTARSLGFSGTALDLILFRTGETTTGTANVDSVRVLEVVEDCPPVADAGPDQTVECAGARTAVTLDGSGSTDPEGNTLTYAWTGGFTEATADGVAPVVHFEALGSYTVSLVVNDGFLDSAADTMTVDLVDTTPPEIEAPAGITVECTNHDGEMLDLGTPRVSDVCDPSPVVTNDAPRRFEVGVTVVTWTATDASGNAATAEQVVTVTDTVAPTLSVSGIPAELWPPNHQLIKITPTIRVSDLCDPDPEVTVRIASSEPDNGQGDGDTDGDVVIRSARDFELRAERSGKGSGRTYTLVFTARDASGNETTWETSVFVPKSQGKGGGPK